MKELFQKSGKLGLIFGLNKHRLANVEKNLRCNRACKECMVPQRYDKENESTLAETKSQIDWLYDRGFRVLSYKGGEPFAPYKTKEGITFLEYTLEVVRHASSRGMMVDVPTNGDYLNREIVGQLKSAGLDKLTLSLHSSEEKDLEDLIAKAKMAAEMRIVPVVNVVLTSENADRLSDIAPRVVGNGVLLSTNIVQEIGGGFSDIPERSQMPTMEQAKKALNFLLQLKRYGFILTDRNYLIDAPNRIENNWKCNPDMDFFIHVGPDGRLGVCPENMSGLKAVDTDLSDESWREQKKELVKKCKGCNYQCWRAAENPSLAKDVPTLITIGLIKIGSTRLVEKLGKFAAQKVGSSTQKV